MVIGERIFLFGGVTQNGRLNDVWELRILADGIAWTNWMDNGHLGLIPRADCVMAVLPDDRLFIYGGYDGKQALSDIHLIDYRIK